MDELSERRLSQLEHDVRSLRHTLTRLGELLREEELEEADEEPELGRMAHA